MTHHGTIRGSCDMNVNKVILVGRVGSDPILNETSKGDAVTNISLATNSGYGDKEKTDWHKVTFFGKLANTVDEYVKKGQELYVEGRISYSKYTDKEGNERDSTSVIAYAMQFGSKLGQANAHTTTSSTSDEDESLPF